MSLYSVNSRAESWSVEIDMFSYCILFGCVREESVGRYTGTWYVIF